MSLKKLLLSVLFFFFLACVLQAQSAGELPSEELTRQIEQLKGLQMTLQELQNSLLQQNLSLATAEQNLLTCQQNLETAQTDLKQLSRTLKEQEIKLRKWKYCCITITGISVATISGILIYNKIRN